MKTKLKSKPKSKSKQKIPRLPLGMQKTHEVSKSGLPKGTPHEVFTPMETGQPDRGATPGPRMPWGAQGGLGPLNQEGEGELQNDQLAALEQFDPEQ
jgi:hypothetical protein